MTDDNIQQEENDNLSYNTSRQLLSNELNPPKIQMEFENNYRICIKLVFIIMILYFIIPFIFITIYYGLSNIINNDILQQEKLYFICNGLILGLLGFITIIFIISTNNIKQCILLLFGINYIIISIFNIIWIILIFSYF